VAQLAVVARVLRFVARPRDPDRAAVLRDDVLRDDALRDDVLRDDVLREVDRRDVDRERLVLRRDRDDVAR
jgi:hypothetical protein